MRLMTLVVGLAFCGAVIGLAACSTGHAAGDGGTSTDTDTVSDFDGGPTTPCVNDPLDDEVCVEGGRFLMGCVPQDTECEDVEKPLHVVQLSPFFIDRKETTWAPFIEFLNTLRDGYIRLPEGVQVDSDPPQLVWANPQWTGLFLFPIRLNDAGNYEWGIPADEYELYSDNEDLWASYIGEQASVGGTTQLGARLYCESIGKRLPTEAQWEYAARGQTTSIYPGWCGDEMDCSWAEYGMCDDVECFEHYDYCAPIEDLSYNECVSVWGVERMAGNAIEWVDDELAGDYSSYTDGCVDPEPMKGGRPIFKGGAISDVTKTHLRISRRSFSEIDWSCTAGIRCTRDDAPYGPPANDAGIDGGK
jgi:formylglycine-generating enzyme required for sulfatase activity